MGLNVKLLNGEERLIEEAKSWSTSDSGQWVFVKDVTKDTLVTFRAEYVLSMEFK